jgi:hypothetical protein
VSECVNLGGECEIEAGERRGAVDQGGVFSLLCDRECAMSACECVQKTKNKKQKQTKKTD